MKQNKLQILFSAITGYDHLMPYSSASDDFYDTYESKEGKLTHLDAYNNEYYGFYMTDDEYERVYNAIESVKNETSSKENAYFSLEDDSLEGIDILIFIKKGSYEYVDPKLYREASESDE